MNEAQENPTVNHDEIPNGGKRLITLWAVCLLGVYLTVAFIGSTMLRGYGKESVNIRKARIASPTMETNAKAVRVQQTVGKKPTDVLVGGTFKRVGDFSLKESAWAADFNLWFRWDGDGVKPDASFRIANGQILQQEVVESSLSGESRYVEMHVAAQMTKDFDATRFPFGENGLYIQVEDNSHGPRAIRFIADTQGSGIEPGALPKGMRLDHFLATTKTGVHNALNVEPGGSGDARQTRSQFVLAMLVVPDGLGLYQKLFQALFASMAIALVALFIKPTHVDCRFGLPVGAFFACISNNIYVGTLLPHADRLTLADMVNGTGLYTIFLILVQSVISLYVFDTMGREKLAILFDRVSFAVILIGYAAVNVALPFSARPL